MSDIIIKLLDEDLNKLLIKGYETCRTELTDRSHFLQIQKDNQNNNQYKLFLKVISELFSKFYYKY